MSSPTMVVCCAVDSVRTIINCAAPGQLVENARRILRTWKQHAGNLAGHAPKSRKLNPLPERWSRSFDTSFETQGTGAKILAV